MLNMFSCAYWPSLCLLYFLHLLHTFLLKSAGVQTPTCPSTFPASPTLPPTLAQSHSPTCSSPRTHGHQPAGWQHHLPDPLGTSPFPLHPRGIPETLPVRQLGQTHTPGRLCPLCVTTVTHFIPWGPVPHSPQLTPNLAEKQVVIFPLLLFLVNLEQGHI